MNETFVVNVFWMSVGFVIGYVGMSLLLTFIARRRSR